jgi:hypothetical protein
MFLRWALRGAIQKLDMPISAPSTRYSLVKGERIVRTVLNTRHMYYTSTFETICIVECQSLARRRGICDPQFELWIRKLNNQWIGAYIKPGYSELCVTE